MQGLWLAIAAYMIWGCFPLFFSLLSSVAAGEVLVHRVIWSLVATLVITLLLKRCQSLLALLRQPLALGWLGVSAMLILSNWLIFIWAVGQQRVMEASLGYFMTPLVSLVLARILLKEKLNLWQALAGGLAALAVGWELYSLGSLPWIPLSLALTFGFYGLVRKRQPVEGINALTIETLWMLPISLIGLSWMLVDHQPMVFAHDLSLTFLLMTCGVLTAIPLLLFAAAAKRLDLSVVGFIMYINPTLQFLSAVLILKEDYPPQRLITFALIWAAMLLFMWGLWQARRKLQAAR